MIIKSSGLLSAALALVFTGRCQLIGASITGDGTAIPTLTLYDNTSNSGLGVLHLGVTATNKSVSIMFPENGIPCSTGLYAVMTDAGNANYIIYYSL